MSILITSLCQGKTVKELGIKGFQMWNCDESYFYWTYTDKVTCLLIGGEMKSPMMKGILQSLVHVN